MRVQTSRLVTVRRIDGVMVTYVRPSYRDIETNYRETDGTQFDRVERGSVSGGVPLVWQRREMRE